MTGPHDSSAPNLESILTRLTDTMQTMNLKLDELLHRPTSFPSPQPEPPPPSPVPATQHKMKLEVPRFDGTEPLGWIFKINQYFEYHGTPERDRLTIASFYMEGRALAWFQWMSSNAQFTSWPGFLQALQTRFAPSQYEDPTGVLFKLTQKGSVNQYLSEFEDLANRVIGLPSPFLLSCFISGLNPEIRREVQAHQPLTLVQAAGLAKLQEEKISDNRLSSRPRAPPPQPNPLRVLPASAEPRQTLPPLLPAPPRPTPPIMKRLTPEELTSRRERGLCFTCDERYHRGHRCAARAFLLVTEEEDPSDSKIDPPDPPPDPPHEPDPFQAQISLNSFSGHLAPEALRMVGLMADHRVVLLIDGGNTHNFVQPVLVTQLGLPCRRISPLRVMVGNGQHLDCACICEGVSIMIQDVMFTMDLHVLPIVGANVVLGVQWLKTLGPILTDYGSLRMQFFHQNQLIELKGENTNDSGIITHHQLRRLCRTQTQASYFRIALITDNPEPPPPHTLPPEIQALLIRFSTLFQNPSGLPPNRDTDHHIHLLPHTNPVNVRPYRYPHYQKKEIEQQVNDMLQKGLIRPSTSPFSSPVLLVRKTDGSWRFCVDYRALNAVTVRDRFPIPTIDELLDELGGAQYFSKLDLLQGYHQIRMHDPDIPKTAFRTHHGHYEFKVMPFGLCNAPSSFQATMNSIFRQHLRHFIIVFFDDILVYSTSFEAHLHHLTITF
ncbi:uncharacterized protein LOC114416356 [Glycine soja]|uniref:uncharacterized protein LOC114416356 n=1 Tax=Glycine soja TaxID=3848 RepID=UPI00103DDAE0|nr:uncharacterized protein LOC114416356 [Glycine soja]